MRRSYLRIRRNRTHNERAYTRERDREMDRGATPFDGGTERRPAHDAVLRAGATTYPARRGRG